MVKNYVALIESSRGIEMFKFSTSINENDKEKFNKELVEKIKNFYFDDVYDIEITFVKNEQNVLRIY
jgi:hypothetical protein